MVDEGNRGSPHAGSGTPHPEVTWDAENLHTHGLRAACSVYGKTRNNETVGLTFTFDGGVLSYDTGKSHTASLRVRSVKSTA
ncbi:hypothetical protein KUBF_10600 [Bacteroides finegoldii]|nr:hypothetical protein KUBF_10600 [Bacteroides finegoldii]